MRFDLPVVGLDTTSTLTKVNARCLAIEEKKTLLLDRIDLVTMANSANLAIVVI
ncbi:UDP-2,3-diacylglucosamine diphosphatase LpxI [bacterium]|nr:UDP-2,3-diacylglucosamine diphosphatase LpxI [bacterium]